MVSYIARAARIAFLAMFGILLFEVTKQALHPNISIWTSHLATVFFVTTMAFMVGVLVLQREARSRSDLLREVEQRRATEQQLRLQTTALEAAANAIVITDAGGTIVWVNRSFSRLTGYNSEEVLGNKPSLLKSKKHDSTFYEHMWRTILSGAVWHGEVTNQRKDGTLYVEEMTITPVRAAGSEITHFIAIKIDVTERKKTQEALLRSETAVRSLVHDAPYGIFRSTAGGKLLSANPALCKMLGYESETELMAVKLPGNVYQNSGDRARLIELGKTAGEFSGVEVAWKKKDGTGITVSLSAHPFAESDGNITFEAFAEDITQRKRDETELRRLNRILSALSMCNRALVHATDEAQLLTEICNIVVEVGGYRLAWVGYAQEGEARAVRLVAKAGFDEGYVENAHITWSDDKWGRGPAGTAIRTGAMCIFNDIVRNPHFAVWRDEAARRGYASIIALPLKESQRILGVLAIYAPEPEAFDSQEVAFLEEMAEDIAYGISSLRSAVERRHAEQALKEAEENYRAIFEEAILGIFQASPEGRPLRVNWAMAQIHGYDSPGDLLAEVSDVAAQLFVHPERMEELNQVVSNHGAVRGAEVEVYRRDGTKKWIAVNLRGVHDCANSLVRYEGTAEDITDRKIAEEKVAFLAYYDSLTGLPNRTLFQDRLAIALAAARRHKEKVAVLFLDLDQFKVINDSLGHSFGDLVLQQVAQRLQRWSREEDTVARVGGDEFLIVLPFIKEVAEAASAAERLMHVMSAELLIRDRPFSVSGSVGISMFPEHGTDCETLIKNADAAMYSAKECGRKTFRFFTQNMNAEVMERLTVENSLRSALEAGQLFLVYQPEMDIVTGEITAVEALLRSEHPDLDSVSTDKLIQVAESSGLIHPIGEWVLETACLQARQWQAQGLRAIPVAVNVSAIQFYSEGFPKLVARMLQETGLAPGYLELELTETVLISNPERMFAVLDELRSAGVKLAIDDFGAGYSSFSYLRRFSADKLKIDRSFIQDVAVNADAAAITSSIINMARSLHIKVIAEGVENDAQLSFLRAHHCDQIQGYYFSKPLTAREVAETLRLGLLQNFSATRHAGPGAAPGNPSIFSRSADNKL